MLRRWSGPALAALGAIFLAAIALLPATAKGELTWWIETSALAPVRILPLVGLGVAIGLAGIYLRIATPLLFGAGIVAGFLLQDRFVAALLALPQAASHDFLTGPVACFAAGLALAPPEKLRQAILPAAAAIVGAMLMFAIRVTDPSLHNPAFPLSGITISAWIVVAIALTTHAFRRGWFTIPARILGSWLLAVGLLYGGASLIPKRAPVLPVAPPPPQAPLPGFERDVPGMVPPAQEQAPGRPPQSLPQ
jgi:hypothetical protein